MAWPVQGGGGDQVVGCPAPGRRARACGGLEVMATACGRPWACCSRGGGEGRCSRGERKTPRGRRDTGRRSRGRRGRRPRGRRRGRDAGASQAVGDAREGAASRERADVATDAGRMRLRFGGRSRRAGCGSAPHASEFESFPRTRGVAGAGRLCGSLVAGSGCAKVAERLRDSLPDRHRQEVPGPSAVCAPRLRQSENSSRGMS
jgi:hypothetical protein